MKGEKKTYLAYAYLDVNWEVKVRVVCVGKVDVESALRKAKPRKFEVFLNSFEL